MCGSRRSLTHKERHRCHCTECLTVWGPVDGRSYGMLSPTSTRGSGAPSAPTAPWLPQTRLDPEGYTARQHELGSVSGVISL